MPSHVVPNPKSIPSKSHCGNPQLMTKECLKDKKMQVVIVTTVAFFPTFVLALYEATTSSNAADVGFGCGDVRQEMLTFRCNQTSCPGRPCIWFNKPECDPSKFQTCSKDLSEKCSFSCYALGEDDHYQNNLIQRSNMTFLIPFASGKSNWHENENAKNPAWVAEETATLSLNQTDQYPSLSNQWVTKIDQLTVPSWMKRVTIAGGSSIVGVRGKVAVLEVAPQVLGDQNQLEAVVLNNLQITQLPQNSLPSKLTSLALSNCLLTGVPADIQSMNNLQALDLSKNYLPSYPLSFGKLESLTSLNLSINTLGSFDAVYPKLTTLDLSNNQLPTIPTAVFKHPNLKELYLYNNSFSNVELSQDQFQFLRRLSVLVVDTFGTPSCGSSAQKQLANQPVCLSGQPQSKSSGSNNSSSLSTGSIVGIAAGCGAALIIVIAGLFLLRKRRQEDAYAKMSSGTPTTTEFTNGSTQNPELLSLWNDQQLLSLQVNVNDIEDIGKIGSGAFGVVYLAKYRSSKLVACKRLLADEATPKNIQTFVQEVKLVAELQHPRIVSLVGVAWTITSDFQALFEYMENGDLRSCLDHSSSSSRNSGSDGAENTMKFVLTETWSKEKLQIAVDVAEALVFLHSFTPPLVHRDLKSRNVLLDGTMRAKVSDFGVSRYRSTDETMTAGVGTSRWLAPEVISGAKDYDEKADIFSFGVVLTELDTHLLPYSDVTASDNKTPLSAVAIMQNVVVGKLTPSLSQRCPAGIVDLTFRCLSYNSEDRPSALEAAYALRSLYREWFKVAPLRESSVAT